MAGITRVNLLFNQLGRPGRLGIGRSTFYDNFVQHSADDPFIPGTDVPRLKLLRLSANATACFDDEVDGVIEGLKRWRDKSFAERKRSPKSENQPEAAAS
jgi:hypothetical protein